MKIFPVSLLPNKLLKLPELQAELRLALIRANLSSRTLPDYVTKILANINFRTPSLYVVLPFFSSDINDDGRTLRNFLAPPQNRSSSNRIRDLDTVQLLSLAMQAVDLDYRQFIVMLSLEYEANPYDDV